MLKFQSSDSNTFTIRKDIWQLTPFAIHYVTACTVQLYNKTVTLQLSILIAVQQPTSEHMYHIRQSWHNPIKAVLKQLQLILPCHQLWQSSVNGEHVVLGLISKRPLYLKFAAPPVIIGFMIFSYCLVYKMIISKHYPFQKVSDQWFLWNLKDGVCKINAKTTVSGNWL